MSWNKRGDFECQSIAIQNEWIKRLMGIERKSTGPSFTKLENPEDIHKICISRKKYFAFHRAVADSISCSFSQNLAKSYVGAPPGRLPPPLRGILDPSLETHKKIYILKNLFN